MSQQKCGFFLREIVERLEKFAPLSLAESWDNVGLLVDPLVNKPVRNILLTNDLTEDVVAEAVQNKSELIVSYHPNIFQPLKSLSSQHWKERVIVSCIKNGIGVYSPHTSWDSIEGGVNDWLAKAFPPCKRIPIVPNLKNPNQGAGRFLFLSKRISLQTAIEMVKTHLDLPYVKCAPGRKKNIDEATISSVALCAGSGGSVLKGTTADLYLTGEMLHHDILDAAQKGISVILTNHSDSERGYLKEVKTRLQEEILENNVDVSVSIVDRDPLITI